jgi:hypothetical protein
MDFSAVVLELPYLLNYRDSSSERQRSRRGRTAIRIALPSLGTASEKIDIKFPNLSQTVSLAISSPLDAEIKSGKVSSWIDIFTQQLNGLSQLELNWNGYGSAAPNANAFTTAQNVLMLLFEMDFGPTRLLPCAEEGISFSFDKANRHAILECYNDGEVCAAFYENNREPQTLEIGNSIEEIREALKFLNAFINASTTTR